ncbi:hypothetical protein Pla108_36040 [Botrimarina colliarenosi]|uniref:Uncharacterized protein n=1 Tax=Botrimarina colliarenosi TaxID=2528001 RepID=A0A5C6A5W5_9BACT|nr:hypothetical protein [Botrimarina colliarenosi]TWT94755.1 hypothetical protein Pla108_36040 [Botrimarina colliarenosi]
MPAQVRSFDAIQLVRDELVKFGQKSTDGIEELAAEIRRVIDWVEHDRPAYWKLRVRKAHDAVTEAKANLHRCLMYPINDEQPSCAEERAALKKAEANLVHCREKQERVRGWARTLRHELHEYEGRIAKLRTLVELDTPRAVALLDRTILSLEKYVSGSMAASAPREADGPAAEETPPETEGETP